MNKIKLSKYLLLVVSLTLTATLVVVIQNSYNKLISAQNIVDRQLTAPFDPTIKTEVLDRIDSLLEAPSDFVAPIPAIPTPILTPIIP
ncbi:MAG: hypothetical protein WCT01_01120 [Candidatus Shapirobacteria bacterium]